MNLTRRFLTIPDFFLLLAACSGPLAMNSLLEEARS
jgi:hypothetical protein